MRNEVEFKKALEHLLNYHSIDSQTNTPDYVLAEQIITLLKDVIAQQPIPEPIKVKPDGWSL